MEKPNHHEMTELGNQWLVDGVKPVTMRDRLQWHIARPMTPNRHQKPLNIELFDVDALNQMDFFDGGKS